MFRLSFPPGGNVTLRVSGTDEVELVKNDGQWPWICRTKFPDLGADVLLYLCLMGGDHYQPLTDSRGWPTSFYRAFRSAGGHPKTKNETRWSSSMKMLKRCYDLMAALRQMSADDAVKCGVDKLMLSATVVVEGSSRLCSVQTPAFGSSGNSWGCRDGQSPKLACWVRL